MAPFKLPVELSRRTLLKTGLIGATFVAAGSVALALQKPRQIDANSKYRVFSASEASVVAALAARLCPAAGSGAPGAEAVDLVSILDSRLAVAEEEAVKGLKLALLMFDNALTGAVFGERARPFTQLSAAHQDRVLEGWRHSKVAFRRTLYRALAYLIMSVYWAEPPAWQRIGYAGPPDVKGLRTTYAENLVDFSDLRPANGPTEI
jgi:hypothetical protein